MEAQSQQGFQDPLSAAVAEIEKASAVSLDVSDRVEASAPALSRDSPTPSTNRQAADGSEDADTAADHEKDEPTDSSSTWSPEVLQPDPSDILDKES